MKDGTKETDLEETKQQGGDWARMKKHSRNAADIKGNYFPRG